MQYFSQPMAYGWIRRTYLRYAVRMAARRADVVIALSEHSRQQILKTLAVPTEKVVVIPNWLPRGFRKRTVENKATERLPGIRAPYLLCVSAFYPYKNIPRLVKAFAIARQRLPDVRLVLAGAETQEVTHEQIHSLIRSLGLGESVMVAGRVEDRYMASLYEDAVAVAMPSLDETFGLPVLEALHYGRPVITSREGPMQEIAGAACVTVDPLEESSIAEGIAAVLANQELRDRLSQAARKQAERFSYESSLLKYAALFGEFENRHSGSESLPSKARNVSPA